MKFISGVLAVVSSIMINVGSGQEQETQCYPSGCFYDLEDHLTKQIECRQDGRQQVTYYEGNNGCDLNKNLLPGLTYISPLINPCCKREIGAIGDPCTYNGNCDWINGEYCAVTGQCALNRCFNPGAPFGANGYCNASIACLAGCLCEQIGAGIDPGYELCVPQNEFTLETSLPPIRPELCGGACVDGDSSTCNAGCKCIDGACQGEIVPPPPQPPIGDESTTYTITINNNNGLPTPQGFGIYQTNPTDVKYADSLPIVFASQTIESGGSDSMSWTLDWGLSYGTQNPCSTSTTGSPLTPGVQYTRTGANVAVIPGDITNNGAAITYTDGSDSYTITGKPDSDLKSGLLTTTPGAPWTNTQAMQDCFTLSVTVGGKPVFAAPGYPNLDYYFDTTPTYYISAQYTETGQIVSLNAISPPKEIKFENGATSVTCDFNENNAFDHCVYST